MLIASLDQISGIGAGLAAQRIGKQNHETHEEESHVDQSIVRVYKASVVMGMGGEEDAVAFMQSFNTKGWALHVASPGGGDICEKVSVGVIVAMSKVGPVVTTMLASVDVLKMVLK